MIYQFPGDSQARNLREDSLSISSFPGASIRHAKVFISHEAHFEVIILLFGRNDLFDGLKPSSTTPQQLTALADFVEKKSSESDCDERYSQSKSGKNLSRPEEEIYVAV